ncbi:hypothetical protein GT347_21945 [Xylophilus rhododendri]|uniref:Uncharacterized protein n=1 Tax=Xylophilus rhododendri TaxID=2697032 RepID=A0A857J8V5_9BURK|nr:hypothetical protein [Xylophilus rhododendri]QHJ00405.1 hypothetical protein GT347_21945 [Xylophilus rhododendri]
MADGSVVDTNVLIVASAADYGSPFRPDATPVQDDILRMEVLDWVQAFDCDAGRSVVLDWDWHICSEYQNKLNVDQDYGWLAMMAKKDRNEVVWIGLEMDSDGHAILPADLGSAVTDLADRKMVAAVLSAQSDGHDCRLVNACDTDWLDCEPALKNAGVHVHQLLGDWLKHKHSQKSKKQRGE